MKTRLPSALCAFAACLSGHAALALSPAQGSAADLFETERVDFFDEHSRLELAADLDGDGSVELVEWWVTWSSSNTARAGFWTQDRSSGVWTEESGVLRPMGSQPFLGATDTVAGDFDGDGRDEVVIFHRLGLCLVEPDASGAPVIVSELGLTLSGDVREAEVVDADGDGLDDLVLVDGGHVRLVRSASGGGFVLVDELPSYGGATRLACVDVDGSSTPEVLLLQDDALATVWTLHVDGGTFHDLSRIFVRPTAGGERIDLVPGDLDADGDLDLVLFGHDGRYEILRNSGGRLTLEADRAGGPATALADLDGDGDLDGICCGGSGTALYNTMPSTFHLSLNSGGADFEPAVAFASVGAHHVAGALDFDLDGDVDVLAGRSVLLNLSEIGAQLCSGNVNSSGVAGQIVASGSASLGSGGPLMGGVGLPAHTACLLLASPAESTVAPWAFWDGALCLGTSGLRRLRTAFADASGAVDFGGHQGWSVGGFNIGATPGLSYGYQIWFRDAQNGGTGAGTSGATRILLTH